MNRATIEQMAEEHLPGDYTIQHTIFTDGDERWKAKHSVGWETGTRFDYILWGSGDLWIDYFEDDVHRDRQIFKTQLQDRVI